MATNGKNVVFFEAKSEEDFIKHLVELTRSYGIHICKYNLEELGMWDQSDSDIPLSEALRRYWQLLRRIRVLTINRIEIPEFPTNSLLMSLIRDNRCEVPHPHLPEGFQESKILLSILRSLGLVIQGKTQQPKLRRHLIAELKVNSQTSNTLLAQILINRFMISSMQQKNSVVQDKYTPYLRFISLDPVISKKRHNPYKNLMNLRKKLCKEKHPDRSSKNLLIWWKNYAQLYDQALALGVVKSGELPSLEDLTSVIDVAEVEIHRTNTNEQVEVPPISPVPLQENFNRTNEQNTDQPVNASTPTTDDWVDIMLSAIEEVKSHLNYLIVLLLQENARLSANILANYLATKKLNRCASDGFVGITTSDIRRPLNILIMCAQRYHSESQATNLGIQAPRWTPEEIPAILENELQILVEQIYALTDIEYGILSEWILEKFYESPLDNHIERIINELKFVLAILKPENTNFQERLELID